MTSECMQTPDKILKLVYITHLQTTVCECVYLNVLQPLFHNRILCNGRGWDGQLGLALL